MELYTTTFGDIYRQHVYNWETGNKDLVPEAWATSFEHCANEDLLIIQNIALGINGHINRDLAHAIVIVGVTPDMCTKHQDSTNVNEVLLTIYNLLETPLAGLYASVIDVTHIKGLVDYAVSGIVNVTREGAWIDAVLLSEAPFEFIDDAIEDVIDATSVGFAETIIYSPELILGSEIFSELKAVEGPNPVTTYCKLVPFWGCT